MGHSTDSEYRRYSAVLREHNKSYAITPTRRPRGKVVVEINGNQGILSCSLKNLKPFQNKSTPIEYGVWLISDDTDKRIPIHTGLIRPNKEGVGESSWSFNPDDVRGTGLDIDSFSTLAVCAAAVHKYTMGERILTGQLELEEAKLSEDPKMEKVSPFGVGLPESQWWKFYPGYFDDLTYYPSVRNNMSSYRQTGKNELLRHNREQVKLHDPALENCYEFGSLSAPAFQGHQLIGLQYDQNGAVKYLVHGIPGRFCLRDQPYGGATGYTYWHPLPGQQYKAGDYGYWLIHIDPVTGEVVFPRKPTRPPSCDECTREM